MQQGKGLFEKQPKEDTGGWTSNLPYPNGITIIHFYNRRGWNYIHIEEKSGKLMTIHQERWSMRTGQTYSNTYPKLTLAWRLNIFGPWRQEVIYRTRKRAMVCSVDRCKLEGVLGLSRVMNTILCVFIGWNRYQWPSVSLGLFGDS